MWFHKRFWICQNGGISACRIRIHLPLRPSGSLRCWGTPSGLCRARQSPSGPLVPEQTLNYFVSLDSMLDEDCGLVSTCLCQSGVSCPELGRWPTPSLLCYDDDDGTGRGRVYKRTCTSWCMARRHGWPAVWEWSVTVGVWLKFNDNLS